MSAQDKAIQYCGERCFRTEELFFFSFNLFHTASLKLITIVITSNYQVWNSIASHHTVNAAWKIVRTALINIYKYCTVLYPLII